ncbi:MAG: AraC family transcriptional regulator [Lachnoclostridium sp.]|nr:AraC family transcriptional regulator [Lachnoclostridium sp.]
MIREFSDKVTYKLLSTKQSPIQDFHLHNFYEMFFLLEGEINFYIHRSNYHVKAGSLIVMNDLEVHRAINPGNQEYKRIYIHIPPDFFNKYPCNGIDLSSCFKKRNTGEKNLILLDKSQMSYFVRQYNHICDSEAYTAAGRELLIDTYLLQILVVANNLFDQHTHTIPNEYSSEIRDVITYLELHLLDKITLEALSNQLSLNKYYLCHRFKEETGTTIFNYLHLRRIAVAKSLLSDGKNVTEACYQSGFNDYSNFITSFKKVTGITPKHYQKQQSHSPGR